MEEAFQSDGLFPNAGAADFRARRRHWLPTLMLAKLGAKTVDAPMTTTRLRELRSKGASFNEVANALERTTEAAIEQRGCAA